MKWKKAPMDAAVLFVEISIVICMGVIIWLKIITIIIIIIINNKKTLIANTYFY